MQSFKTNLLAGASALLVAAAFSAPASAANISGGGSSLIAPYLVQAFDCHTNSGSGQANIYDANGTSLSFVSCPSGDGDTTTTDTTSVYQVATVGSGAGIKGFLTETAANMFTAGITLPSGFTDVAYAVSDGPLTEGTSTSDIDVWNNGGTDSRGFTVAAHSGQPLLQFPVSIDPVALAFNPNYHSPDDNMDHPLDIQTGSRTLELTREVYCGIFNGDIRFWDDARLTALNGGASLTDSHTNVPIHIVGRQESSGTTQLFTRHLFAACAAEKALGHIATNFYDTTHGISASGANFTPNGTTGVVGGPYTNGVSYDLKANSSGVSNEIAAVPGAIGYLGPDYTGQFEMASGAPANGLLAADLVNFNDSTLYDVSGATAAFSNQAPNPPSGTAQNDPANWVPNSVLADPAVGYPIVGTTNIILKSVYSSSSISTPVKSFLNWYYTTTQSDDVLNDVGLAPLPSNWKSAIATYAAASITP